MKYSKLITFRLDKQTYDELEYWAYEYKVKPRKLLRDLVIKQLRQVKRYKKNYESK